VASERVLGHIGALGEKQKVKRPCGKLLFCKEMLNFETDYPVAYEEVCFYHYHFCGDAGHGV
jgi:hypothetical protein